MKKTIIFSLILLMQWGYGQNSSPAKSKMSSCISFIKKHPFTSAAVALTCSALICLYYADKLDKERVTLENMIPMLQEYIQNMAQAIRSKGPFCKIMSPGKIHMDGRVTILESCLPLCEPDAFNDYGFVKKLLSLYQKENLWSTVGFLQLFVVVCGLPIYLCEF